MFILTILSLLGGCAALAFLIITDLKYRLLLNTYVLAFALFGMCFHISTYFEYTSLLNMMLGFLTGGCFLLLVRALGNRVYKQDTLGLGDVKLMAAGGIWLGAEGILHALVIGALAGIIHGVTMMLWARLIYKESFDMRYFTLPAGPGFIVGIIAVAVYKFYL